MQLPHPVRFIVYLALAMVLTAVFTRCSPVKKAIETFDKHPDAAAEYCADRFPVKDSLIKGDTVTTIDTSYEMLFITDTVRTLDTVRITITKPVTVTKTRIITDTVIRENTARVTALNNQVEACQVTVNDRDARITRLQADYDGMKAKRNKWRLWLWIAVGAVGAYTALKIKKLIPF